MGFLAGLVADLAEWAITKGVTFLSALWSKLSNRTKVIDAAQASVQPLKDAKTGDAVDKATDSTLSGL